MSGKREPEDVDPTEAESLDDLLVTAETSRSYADARNTILRHRRTEWRPIWSW